MDNFLLDGMVGYIQLDICFIVSFDFNLRHSVFSTFKKSFYAVSFIILASMLRKELGDFLHPTEGVSLMCFSLVSSISFIRWM